MRRTISLYKDCLKHPVAHLSTMSTAEILSEQSNDPEIWRTTNFAEAEVKIDGKKYILAMPLSDEAHLHALRKVTLMNKFISSHITSSEMLIDEMMFYNRTGDVEYADLLLHHIPDGDTLYNFAEFASRDRLLEALDKMEAEFKRLEIVHNNLTPHNIIVGKDYDLYAIRYHYVEKATSERDCGAEFAAIREWINMVVDIDNDGAESKGSDVAPYKIPASLFSGYKHVSNPFEDLVCVADERGYLYVNCENKVIIDGRFKWASDFHEGRAEVETETGMGLIDREGNYIIEPIYKIVDYDIECGLSRVRNEDQWALYNYMGEQILPFEERYIDDEDLELLSI
ncbi:MAG: WG repeat-containing protein [Rikenellaceae bacterium]